MADCAYCRSCKAERRHQCQSDQHLLLRVSRLSALCMDAGRNERPLASRAAEGGKLGGQPGQRRTLCRRKLTARFHCLDVQGRNACVVPQRQQTYHGSRLCCHSTLPGHARPRVGAWDHPARFTQSQLSSREQDSCWCPVNELTCTDTQVSDWSELT